MKKILLLAVCSFTLLGSCKKTEVEEILVTMYYKETQCSNPWEATPESENYLNEVKNYLKENKVIVQSIEVRRISSPPIYGGCTVLSGRRIYIEIDEKYATTASTFGFILLD